ncbi:hypothetical protein SEVIR_5G329400v4 [Setaria viridis]
MAEAKPEEISHPPMEQLQGFEYCIDSNPPWGEAIILAFQHYILALGTAVMIPAVLVPMMGGDDGDRVRVVQTLLFVTGINTLLQSLFGTRLPTVIGGSYAFVIPIVAIIQDSSLAAIPDGHERFLETMRAIQGALIVSSSIQIILGYSQLWGIFSRFFSPVGMAPVVALLGFGLFERGFPVVGRCVEVGLPMLILFVVLSQYLKNIQIKDIPILERFSLFICIALVWAYAQILTSGGAYKNSTEVTQINCRTDRANLISSAPWIKIPYPLQWGAPTFNAGQSFGMVSAVLVSLVESTASYKAAARLASATPPPAHILSRGIGWQVNTFLHPCLFFFSCSVSCTKLKKMLCGNTRESASSLMGYLERALAPLSQCECLYQNFHHCAFTDHFFPQALILPGTPMQGERRAAWIDKDREPACYTDLCRFHDLFLHAGEIRSAVCFHPIHHLRSRVLRLVWARCCGGAVLLAVH